MFVSHRTRAGAVLAAAAVLVAMLSGCSSSPTGSTSGTSDTKGPAAAAQATVDEFTGAYGKPDLPTEPIKNIASLKGRTVIYIPALAVIPIFATAFDAYKDAFSRVGVKAVLCDAKSDPAATSACFQQAIDTKAAGVILESLPPAFAQEAYKATIAAGIPVLLADTTRPADAPNIVQFGGPNLSQVTSVAADAIIASSGGKAHVLTIGSLDSDAPITWMKAATDEFAKKCPDCKVTKLTLKTSDVQNLASQVSAALLADPSIDYMLPQFGSYVQPAIQGGTNAGRQGLKLVSTTTTLGDLSIMKTNSDFVGSVSWDIVLNAWMNSDLLMRLAVGQKVDASKYVQPIKVFTPKNSAGFTLTPAAWANSSWYGGDGFKQQLVDLWSK
jgi:ribose transport system substrate-binding protein